MPDEITAPDGEEIKAPIEGEGDDTTPKKDVETPEAKPEGEEGEEGKTPPIEKKDEDTDEPEIPTRASAQHIIARKNKQLEKLRSEKEMRSKKDDEEDYDDDDLTPEARKAMDRRIQSQIDPIVETLTSRVDEDELQSLLKETPEAKGYEKRIRAYMNHPAYKQTPPSFIFKALAFDAAASIGAKKKQVADKEAALNKGAGSPKKLSPGKGVMPSAEEIANMSDADFEKLQHDVLHS